MSEVGRRLPLEILDKIIMNLKYLDDECSAALVNKTWYQVAQRYIYGSVYIDHEDAAVLYSETLCIYNSSLSSHTRSLDILSTTTKKVPRIVLRRIMESSWPNLESLTVATTASEWLWSTTNLPVFPRLSHLELVGGTNSVPAITASSMTKRACPAAVARSLPSLTSLRLENIDLTASQDGSADAIGDMLAFMMAASERMQDFHYHILHSGESLSLRELLDNMSDHLVRLTISGPDDLFGRHLVEGIECLPNLEELHLNAIGTFSSTFAPPPSLVKLHLRGTRIDTECLLSWLLEFSKPDTLPCLTSIPFLHFYGFSDRGPILQRTARQARIAWDSLRAREGISAPLAPDTSYGASWHLYANYTPG